MTARILRILNEAERILNKHSPPPSIASEPSVATEPPQPSHATMEASPRAVSRQRQRLVAAQWTELFKQYEPRDGYKAALDAMKDKK